METIRKNYTLSAGLAEQIADLQAKAAEKHVKLSEITIVSLALTRGLPLAAESLGLEVICPDDQPELATV